MAALPSYDNLAVCEEHGIMTHSRDDPHGTCALCALGDGYEVKRDVETPGEPIRQQEVRQRLEAEDLVELLPLMREYLEDKQDDVTLFVTVERFDGDLPAGYSEAQERWLNVVVYHFGNRVKAITDAPTAQQTIATLSEKGYGGSS